MRTRTITFASLSLLFAAGCSAADDDSTSGSESNILDTDDARQAPGQAKEGQAKEGQAKETREESGKPATGWLTVTSKKCGQSSAPIAKNERYLLDDDMFVRAIRTEESATRTCHDLNVTHRLKGSSETSDKGSIETGVLVSAVDITRCETTGEAEPTDTDAPASEAGSRSYTIRRDATNTSVVLTIEGAAECASSLELELRP